MSCRYSEQSKVARLENRLPVSGGITNVSGHMMLSSALVAELVYPMRFEP